VVVVLINILSFTWIAGFCTGVLLYWGVMIVCTEDSEGGETRKMGKKRLTDKRLERLDVWLTNISVYDDCDTKPSVDSDGGDYPKTAGYVTDYAGCSGTSCSYTTGRDTCNDPDELSEYVASGLGYSYTLHYCDAYDTCVSDQATFRDYSCIDSTNDYCGYTDRDRDGESAYCTTSAGDCNAQTWMGTYCCEDDAGENYIYNKGIWYEGGNYDSGKDIPSDNACCSLASACVDDGQCFAPGDYSDSDGDGDVERCSSGNHWYEIDSYSYGDTVVFYPNLYGLYCEAYGYIWNIGGEAVSPKDDSSGLDHCCEDDASEHYTTTVCTGSSTSDPLCCNNANYKIRDGNCVSICCVEPGGICTEDSQCCDTGGDYYCRSGTCVTCDDTGCEEDRCQVETYCEDANCDWSNGYCCDDGYFWDPDAGECRPFSDCITPCTTPWDPNCVQEGIACCEAGGYTYRDPVVIYP